VTSVAPSSADPAAAEAAQAEALLGAGDAAGAVAAYKRALAVVPGSAVLWTSLGVALQRWGRLEDAIAAHRRAIARAGTLAGAHYNLGVALLAAGRAEEAVVGFAGACRHDPRLAAAWINLAVALLGLGRLAEAETALAQGAALAPNQPEMLATRGTLARELGCLEAAETAYRAAIAARPNFAEAHANLGTVLRDRGQIAEAAASLERALALGLREPAGVLGHLSHLYKLLCRWADAAAIAPAVIAAVRGPAGQGGSGAVHPFAFLAEEEAGAADQLLCARAYVARRCPGGPVASAPAAAPRVLSEVAAPRDLSAPDAPRDLSAPDAPRPLSEPAAGPFPGPRLAPRAGNHRLRIGYLSADFHQHATAVLLAEVIEMHDRTDFEVVGYSYGPDDGGPMRARLRAGFDLWRCVRGQPAPAVAGAIRADGIDILIDLKGHTHGARPEIPALRPAPLQLAYLGFPGTTGAPFIDYAVVDPVVAPAGAEAWFTESLIRLPECYQPNDRQRPRPETGDEGASAPGGPDRAACGLPARGFVFCCFNASYKITPHVFAVWMRLLEGVPGSVLWLLEVPVPAMVALRREAAARGVAPERLVFAPRWPLDAHLARHRHAGLFLDTLPVNAHTTASDALWAGVPVVTCAGSTMVGRVGASLLHAVGLPELVTAGLDGYEALAFELATNTAALARLRRQLAAARDHAPLFDTPRYVRHLEAACRMIWERYRSGLPPASLNVPALPPGNSATVAPVAPGAPGAPVPPV